MTATKALGIRDFEVVLFWLRLGTHCLEKNVVSDPDVPVNHLKQAEKMLVVIREKFAKLIYRGRGKWGDKQLVDRGGWGSRRVEE